MVEEKEGQELKQERKSESREGRRQRDTVWHKNPRQVKTHISHDLGQLGTTAGPTAAPDTHTDGLAEEPHPKAAKHILNLTYRKLKVSLCPSCQTAGKSDSHFYLGVF